MTSAQHAAGGHAVPQPQPQEAKTQEQRTFEAIKAVTEKRAQIEASMPRISSALAHVLARAVGLKWLYAHGARTAALAEKEHRQALLAASSARYNAAGVGESLMRLVFELDGVQTGGNPAIRAARKAEVLSIQRLMEAADALKAKGARVLKLAETALAAVPVAKAPNDADSGAGDAGEGVREVQPQSGAGAGAGAGSDAGSAASVASPRSTGSMQGTFDHRANDMDMSSDSEGDSDSDSDSDMSAGDVDGEMSGDEGAPADSDSDIDDGSDSDAGSDSGDGSADEAVSTRTRVPSVHSPTPPREVRDTSIPVHFGKPRAATATATATPRPQAPHVPPRRSRHPLHVGRYAADHMGMVDNMFSPVAHKRRQQAPIPQPQAHSPQHRARVRPRRAQERPEPHSQAPPAATAEPTPERAAHARGVPQRSTAPRRYPGQRQRRQQQQLQQPRGYGGGFEGLLGSMLFGGHSPQPARRRPPAYGTQRMPARRPVFAGGWGGGWW